MSALRVTCKKWEKKIKTKKLLLSRRRCRFSFFFRKWFVICIRRDSFRAIFFSDWILIYTKYYSAMTYESIDANEKKKDERWCIRIDEDQQSIIFNLIQYLIIQNSSWKCHGLDTTTVIRRFFFCFLFQLCFELHHILN